MTPKTAAASVLPETCGIPQLSRTIVTCCASCSHAAALFCASSRPHETLNAAKKKMNSHKKAQESQKCLDFISIRPLLIPANIVALPKARSYHGTMRLGVLASTVLALSVYPLFGWTEA